METVSYMKNNNTEKTPHQQLIEKLDDTDFAREFFTEKQKEAEELIAQILMVTSGVCHSERENGVTEWGHENLFQLLNLFLIRHENFDRSQIAENLQQFLFGWTMKHSAAYDEWSAPLEVATTSYPETSGQTQDAPAKAETNHALPSTSQRY